jgi:hypothetical protein
MSSLVTGSAAGSFCFLWGWRLLWWAGVHRPAAAAACQFSFFYGFYRKLTEPSANNFRLLFCWLVGAELPLVVVRAYPMSRGHAGPASTALRPRTRTTTGFQTQLVTRAETRAETERLLQDLLVLRLGLILRKNELCFRAIARRPQPVLCTRPATAGPIAGIMNRVVLRLRNACGAEYISLEWKG